MNEREQAQLVRDALNAAATALHRMHPNLTIIVLVHGAEHGTVSLATCGIDDVCELGDYLAGIAASYNARVIDGRIAQPEGGAE